MHNYQFNALASNIIIGALVAVTSIVIWFTMHAFAEIGAIEESIATGSEIYD